MLPVRWHQCCLCDCIFCYRYESHGRDALRTIDFVCTRCLWNAMRFPALCAAIVPPEVAAEWTASVPPIYERGS